MFKLLFPFIISVSLLANEIVVVDKEKELIKKNLLTIEEITQLEKGLKRDLFINEYLQQEISSKEAFDTLSLIDNMSEEIFFNFSKKFEHAETEAVAQCMRMPNEDLVYSYADCIVNGLDLSDASNLSALEQDLVLQKTKLKYPTFHKKIKILSSSIPFTKLIIQKKELFYEIYMNVEDSFRAKYFNYKLPKRTFTKVFEDKEKFNDFLSLTLPNTKLDKLNKSLLEVDDSELNFDSSFLLALNAIRFKDLNKAYIYLQNSLKKSTNDIKKTNKANFWLYLITNDEAYIEKITPNNFYSQLVIESNKIKVTYPNEKIAYFENYISNSSILQAIAKVKTNFDENYISKNFDIGITSINIKKVKELSKMINFNYTINDYFKLDENLKISNLYIDLLKNKNSNIAKTLFSFENKNSLLDRFKEENSLELLKSEFKPYFICEIILNGKNEYLKELLYSYVYYYNTQIRNPKNRESLTVILQNLIEPHQTLNK